MRAVSTSLRRALHLGLALGRTALLCACPPNWDGLNPPGNDAGVVAPQDAGDVPQDGGNVDAGTDGGADAGPPDAGLPDGGFFDAGPDAGNFDGGPDGGEAVPDAGFDAGVEGGNCATALPDVVPGWTCLSRV